MADGKQKTDGADILKAIEKATKKKVKKWSMENVQNRNVADRLNELSKDGFTVFSVSQSVSVGGSYEIIFYIDKPESAKTESSEE